MKTIIKYIIKNIWENKFRTILIILTVVVSSALFFVSSSITDTTVHIFEQSARKYCGNSDIKIISNKEYLDSFFNYIDISNGKIPSIEYSIGLVQGNGFYKHNSKEDINMMLIGIDWEDLQKINPILLKEESNNFFEDKKIIISQQMADKYDLTISSEMKLLVNGIEYGFIVGGISDNIGPFTDDGRTIIGVVNKDSLSSIYNREGMINTQYIKLDDDSQMQEVIEELSLQLQDYEVEEAISSESSAQTVNMIVVVFNVVTMIVVLLGAFIIYSTFKTITLERLPIIGTFRSIGATKKVTNLILLGESVLYGVIGGLIGSALGLGMLHLISSIIAPAWGGNSNVTVIYSIFNLIFAFFMGIALTFISSFIPIMKIKRLSLTDVILNRNEEIKKKHNKSRLVIALIILVFTQVSPRLMQGKFVMLIDVICIILTIILIGFLTPYIVNGFSYLFRKISYYTHNNEGELALKNLQDNTSVKSNIVMIAIGIASLLMISTVGKSVISEVVDTFSNANYEMTFSTPVNDEGVNTKVEKVNGIKSYTGIYQELNVKIDDSTKKIAYLDGVNSNTFLDYFNINFVGNKDIINQLNDGRNIILNYNFKNQFEVGDKVVLEVGENEKKEYKLIGFMDTVWVGGSYGIISEEYFKSDFAKNSYDGYLIKIDKDINKVIKDLKQQFLDETIVITRTDELRNRIIDANSIMFVVVTAFTVIAILIGIVGVFNNILISFMRRKQSLALYRSLGMSKKQMIKMILIESFASGLIGGLIGVLFGIMLIEIMPLMLREVMATINMTYSISAINICILTGIFMTVISSIGPLIKTLRSNILNVLKYE